MKTTLSILLLVTITFFLSGCKDMNSVVTSPESVQTDNMVNVPFKGTIEGTVATPVPTHKIFTGTGIASHLGTVEAVIDYWITYTTQYSGTISSGICTLTAANGDELYIDVVSGNWHVVFTTTPPTVLFDVVGEIDGGTGRFASAEGSATGNGTQIYVANTPTVFEWEGTISY